jgi:O-antigen/teichoic acid export membrane protein
MLFQAMKRTDTVLRLALVKFIAEFGSYFALVPTVGLSGAGWANVTGAAAAFAGALVVGQQLVPEHAGRRLTIMARALMLVAPLLVLTMIVDWALQGWAGLLLRLAILAGGGIGLFAFGLVLREDLATLSAIPLAWEPMRRVRDLMVASVDWLARAIEPRRIL